MPQAFKTLSRAEAAAIADLKERKHRRATGLFWVEGEKLTREALNQIPTAVKIVVTTREYAEKKADFPFDPAKTAFVSPSVFEKLSHLERSEPVGAVMLMPPPPQTLPDGPGVVLWGVQDPANLGAVLRVADWFGMRCVAVAGGAVDVFNIKTLRAAMGSAFRVPVHDIGNGDLFLQRHARECVGADAHGKFSVQNPKIWNGARYIVLGSESKGLPEHVKKALKTVFIPGSGGAESLNLAVAAGILAYAWHAAGSAR